MIKTRPFLFIIAVGKIHTALEPARIQNQEDCLNLPEKKQIERITFLPLVRFLHWPGPGRFPVPISHETAVFFFFL